jgi:DNA-binding transcriptional MerR regulator
MLGIPPHTLRYRATRAGIRVLRTSGNHGRRLFRAGDIERLSQVASLLKEGYRLDGARRRIEAPLPDRRALSILRLELVRLKDGFSTTGIRRDP